MATEMHVSHGVAPETLNLFGRGITMAPSPDRRCSERVDLAIAVFIVAQDQHGHRFTELALAMNIGTGGALIASRGLPAVPGRVSMELPRPPMPRLASTPVTRLEGEIVRVVHNSDHHLLGVRFLDPILSQARNPAVARRRCPRLVCEGKAGYVRDASGAELRVNLQDKSDGGVRFTGPVDFTCGDTIAVATEQFEGQNIFRKGRIVRAQSGAEPGVGEYAVSFGMA